MAEQSAIPPDESRSNELYAVISVWTFIVFVSTTARVASKLYLRTKFSWDDYFIILSAALNIAGNGFDFRATNSGFGRHSHYLATAQKIDAAKNAQFAVLMAALAAWAAKMSICFFLLSMIRGTHRYFRWFIRALMVVTTISAFVACLMWGLQARPLPKLWDPTVPGTREDASQLVITCYVVYALGLFTDILYCSSPIYFLWDVKISLRQKLPILAVTGCGGFVVVVAILNIVFASDFLNVEDSTWALTNEFICDITERNLTAFVANLPSLWMLTVQLRNRRRAKQSSAATLIGKGTSPTKTQVTSQGLETRELKAKKLGTFSESTDTSNFEAPGNTSPSIGKIEVTRGFDVESNWFDADTLRDVSTSRSFDDDQLRASYMPGALEPAVTTPRSPRPGL